jgi:VIT1/CCC1 family predicted Fe2+/Mn2+ transporter
MSSGISCHDMRRGVEYRQRVSIKVKQTGKSTAAGVLNLVSGFLSLIGAISLVIPIFVYNRVGGSFLDPIFFTAAIILAVTGILGLLGGISALRRKTWGLALAGSIASIFPCFPLGIAAVILTALSRDEFA